MVTDLDDLKELGKEMEQISQENDEEKLNQSHDNEVRSDLKTVNRFHKNPVTYQYVKLLDFYCIIFHMICCKNIHSF